MAFSSLIIRQEDTITKVIGTSELEPQLLHNGKSSCELSFHSVAHAHAPRRRKPSPPLGSVPPYPQLNRIISLLQELGNRPSQLFHPEIA